MKDNKGQRLKQLVVTTGFLSRFRRATLLKRLGFTLIVLTIISGLLWLHTGQNMPYEPAALIFGTSGSLLLGYDYKFQ